MCILVYVCCVLAVLHVFLISKRSCQNYYVLINEVLLHSVTKLELDLFTLIVRMRVCK